MNPRYTPYTRGQGLADLLAMGTMIQRFKLSEEQYRGARFKDFHRDVKGNNELLSLTRPDIIADVHAGYLAAGADMIETNTFGAISVAQDDYDMANLVYEMNLASAKLARAAADQCARQSIPASCVARWAPPRRRQVSAQT